MEAISRDDNFDKLMQHIGLGSEDAAWELVERYGRVIRLAVRRALKEELRSQFDSLDFVQLVWSSFFRDRARQDQFDSPQKLAACLAAMARNKVVMEVRRGLLTEKNNVGRELSLNNVATGVEAEVPDTAPSPVEFAIAREQWERLVDSQPERYREIISLRLQGHTNQEVADSLGMDEGTVRRFLKKLLRQRVQ